MHNDTFYTHIDPNPHIALNNARLEAEQERAEIRDEETRLREGHRLQQDQETRLRFLALLEDKARLDQLEAMGATWSLPFIADGPLAFDRETIDETLRHHA